MRDVRHEPEPGDTAVRKRGKTPAAVLRVDHHLNGDISYIKLRHETGYEKTIVLYE